MKESMKYITVERMKSLEESISWLSNHTNENVVIGESLSQIDIVRTKLLQELATINLRRKEIIADLMQ